jgi:NitT/TauT family transport system permease protein
MSAFRVATTSDGASTAAVEPPAAGAVRRTLTSGRMLMYAASVCLGLAIWQIAAMTGVGHDLLPGPATVASKFWELTRSGFLEQQVAASLERVAIGFVLGVVIAVPTGFVMGWYRWASGLIEPWVQFLRTIPPLALIPLVIVFLGIGQSAKVMLIFLAAYLATVIAVFQGVRNVDKTLINAARVLGAGDRTIFLSVVVPAALPYILVGMRIALGNAWATLVAAELIAATSGLGHMMQTAATYFQISTVMVGVITIGVLGFVMDRGILWLDRRLTRWQDTQEQR